MDKIILMFCSLISCVIIVNLLFQFLNDRYEKVYDNKLLYRMMPVASVLLLTGTNMLMIPILNLMVHFFLFGFVSCFLYYDRNNRKMMRIVEIEVFCAVIVVLEMLGVTLLDLILKLMGRVPASIEILQSMETAFSKIILLFLYYIVFSRLWKKTALRTRTQYILYFILFVYSMVNVLVISFISDKESPVILMLIVGCIVFANMYMLYFIKFSDERNCYKQKIDMMEQQEKLQFENYAIQKEKYEDVMSILHDVDKHIKLMEKLYQENLQSDAISYTRQINDMLQPLVPFKYTNNPILNCLLSDKSKAAERMGIKFEIGETAADINFMKPVDITTLFGNLIDNAITATAKCEEDRYVGLFISAFHEMVSIRVENRVIHKVQEEIPIKNGKLQDEKKGIGIMNIERCVNTYDGSIIYKCENELFVCDIVLSRIGN